MIRKEENEYKYAHNPSTRETRLEDITEFTIQVFERDGKHPVFVLHESLNNQGPPLKFITEKFSQGMKMYYGMEPKDLIWFEQQPDRTYHQVHFRDYGAEPHRSGGWGEYRREREITKDYIEQQFLERGLISEPRQKKHIEDHSKDWGRLEASSKGAETRNEYKAEKELERNR